jgi:hypothetical protein
LGSQRLELAGRAGARLLRARTDTFHGFEKRVTLVCAQRIAQQLAEQTDIVSKRFVGVVWQLLRVYGEQGQA